MLGRTVNQYEILEKLGQGGMGVVFKARDTRLGRLVALKFLPQSLADDPQAMERLRREARAASSLNHPHICTLHDIGEADGRPFIVMELLEGETLRHRLSTGGALLPEEVVELGTQIADALEAAHARGILHRDIKPENVFLTRRGAAKLMDFGLAKFSPLLRGPGPEGSASPTASMQPETLTGPGMAVGTVAYMSPEQARGLELDARSDLFSLGDVLYEMATGRMAFDGPTAAVVFDAILNRAPRSVGEAGGPVPEKLVEIIEKAMEKDRELRYQSAAEIRTDLRRLRREVEAGLFASYAADRRPVVVPSPRPRWKRRILLGGLGLAVVAAMTLLARQVRTASPAGAPDAPRELRQRQLTGFGSEQRVITTDLSPDGKLLAFVTPKGLFIQVLASGVTQPVPLPEEFRTGVWSVDWFPDGASLAVTMTDPDDPQHGVTLYSVSMLGGTPRRLQEGAFDPQVSPDGTQIAFWGKEGLLVAGSDGTGRRVLVENASENDGQFGLTWSPDGRSVLYARPQKPGALSEVSLEDVPLSGGAPVTLATIPESNSVLVAWARDGRIFYVTGDEAAGDTNLWELRTGGHDHRVTGSPRKVTHLVGAPEAELSLGDDAKRMAILRVNVQRSVWIGDLTAGGRRLENVHRLDSDLRFEQFPLAWMPGGEGMLTGSVRNDLMEIALRRPGDQEQVQILATGLKASEEAVVTSDGSWLLYEEGASADRGGSAKTQTLMKLRLRRGSPEALLEIGEGAEFDCGTLPGSGCVLGERHDDRMTFFDLSPLTGKGKELCTVERIRRFDLSPDGRRLALPEGMKGIRVVPLAGGSEKKIELEDLPDRIRRVVWSADGKGLFAVMPYGIASTDLAGKATVLLHSPRELFVWDPVPSPDGRHLAFQGQKWENNVWLLEGF